MLETMYTISLITTEEKERLTAKYQPRIRYELKSELYGCCIKLICDDHTLKDTWEDNFYSMSQNVRSHGRILAFKDPDYQHDSALYDAYSKTLFLINFEYDGWIKSLALSLAGDILEDEHDIFSVHGACVDVGGTGVCLVGAPGAGKDNSYLRAAQRPAHEGCFRRLVLLAGVRFGYPCVRL